MQKLQELCKYIITYSELIHVLHLETIRDRGRAFFFPFYGPRCSLNRWISADVNRELVPPLWSQDSKQMVSNSLFHTRPHYTAVLPVLPRLQVFFFFAVFFCFVFLLFWGFLNRTLEFLTDHFLFVGVLQTQRRVTFHLPDGSQESCSDSGLGDPEPSSTASTTQPLPLSFPQEEYYEQTSPNSRTEGDGNSDPESSEY